MFRFVALCLGVLAMPALVAAANPRTVDYIVAVVNQELVTAVEVDKRAEALKTESARRAEAAVAASEWRKRALESLVEERAVLSFARENGGRVDAADVDRAVYSVALQNQMNLQQLIEKLRDEGTDYQRFRANMREQILMERAREREVTQRIRITEADIDAFIATQRDTLAGQAEFNIAQILVAVADGAGTDAVALRQARADQALARARAREPFPLLARQLSDDANREIGGEIGLHAADRLPELFVAAVKSLRVGEVAPQWVRSGAGFHVLKLIERKDSTAYLISQRRVRHILLRVSPSLSVEVATQRLRDVRRQVESGQRRFEDVAREMSEDGSAPQGGDLGWSAAGAFVPEFEEAMNGLLVGGVSPPVVTRFGVHLVQVLDRRQISMEAKQVRDQARYALREQKFESAYREWVAELRARAYVELREPPQ